MAATKEILARYSADLDPMASMIKRYLQNSPSRLQKQCAERGIQDFLYRYPESFKRTFLGKVGLNKFGARMSAKPSPAILGGFVNRLSKMDAEAIFLLKDAWNAAKKYQRTNVRGYGILVNRNFLSENGDERIYFALIGLFYKSLLKSKTQNEFLKNYVDGFAKIIKKNHTLREKAAEIADYVENHSAGKEVIFVDMGFQFTLALLCYASLVVFSKRIKPDFYCFSTYPWLQQFFKDKYFSERSELVLDYELESIRYYYQEVFAKAKGCLVGFAIGDALGFPAAGIKRGDVSHHLSVPIRGFLRNNHHPYFSHLRSGQYTDNTNSLIVTTKDIIRNGKFDVSSYQRALAKWGKKILANKMRERWAGPTLIAGIRNLLRGKTYKTSGSKTTQSCSSIYRVIPLGIHYRSFSKPDASQLPQYAKTAGMITHNSDISKTGTIIMALIVADLMSGVLPLTAVKGALSRIHMTKKSRLLIENIEEAVRYAKSKTVEEARKRFGTGSPIYQTLPLAIFCFLKYQNDFETGILAAANSFREDTEEEKKRLRDLTWEQQLLEAKGGNSDGIAGLTGALLGAHLGVRAIPRQFRKVENFHLLFLLSQRLVR